ncbi:MAG: hypothetical protein M0013_08780 [Actinomycetota bacterium]|nr:hypothetical protein [Actinomycetota bacterium]
MEFMSLQPVPLGGPNRSRHPAVDRYPFFYKAFLALCLVDRTSDVVQADARTDQDDRGALVERVMTVGPSVRHTIAVQGPFDRGLEPLSLLGDGGTTPIAGGLPKFRRSRP